MRVSGILHDKGAEVATIAPNRTLGDAAEELRRRRIGALVVTDADGRVDGIISERDMVHALALFGIDVLTTPVSAVMSTDVWTCAPDDSAERLARMMTDHRSRHLPVVENDELIGIVSIGDVVKSRLNELERERDQLTDYITTGR